MDIPKHFTDELDRMLEEDRKAKEKEQSRKASEDEDRKLREGRLETNLGICEKIFDWKDEFLKTDEGSLLLSKGFIKIYGGGWGHLPETDDSVGCHSCVYITDARVHIEDGKIYTAKDADAFKYTYGYKWLPSQRQRFIEPREMAVTLNHEYLTRLFETMESGKVFDYILKNNR